MGGERFKNAPQVNQIFPKLATLSIWQHCSSKPRGAKSQQEPGNFRPTTARVHEGSKSCRCRTRKKRPGADKGVPLRSRFCKMRMRRSGRHTFYEETFGIPSLRSGLNRSRHGLWKSVFFIEKTAFLEPWATHPELFLHSLSQK